ncbi:GtrA family protein [Leucobacter viscericola]|uniref:GtrA family protein n=1 Tax=Leucobacter viscericola TaxID=2714935 RepID=A0A6G7XEX9_9MICO|nr:GtrA family protein [Leucobacter viscericola]QIK63026.1 GtrA family protein [Leucobacter viscericola]
MPQISQRLKQVAKVGVKFLIVGGISTLIEVAAFNLLLFAAGWDLVPAKIAASLIALINAYFGNREWAFRHRERRQRTDEVVRFLIVNLLCTGLGAALVWIGVEAAALILNREIGPYITNFVNLASIVVVVLVRFLFYNRFVFRPGQPKTGQQSGKLDLQAAETAS